MKAAIKPLRLLFAVGAILPLATSLAVAQPAPPPPPGVGGPGMHHAPPPPHRRWHWRNHHRVYY